MRTPLRLLQCQRQFQFHHPLLLRRRFLSSNSDTVTGEEIRRSYDPSSAEVAALKKWNEVKKRRLRNEGGSEAKGVFRMLLPPPNVTGKLHLGHFLTVAVEDTIARWKWMNGLRVEWIPGFDHAGIATQSVVNRKLSKQTEPTEMGTAINTFAGTNLTTIKSQLEKSGALLDWSKEYYTLDENHSDIVKEAFIQLFQSGLIRRDNGIVNWSCALETSIADVEVDEIEFDKMVKVQVPGYKYPVNFGILYYIAYPVQESDDALVVATSRPETMFGDVAIAVNPDDSRYVQFIGKQVKNPLTGGVIPVVSDSRVKADFGTGIVKVTPAHDKLDFVIGRDHGLHSVNILTKSGLMNENCGEFKGVPRFIARKKVLEILAEKSALLNEQPYTGSLRVCSRSGDVIEPRLLPHWFLQTQFLSNKVIQAISDKTFIIVPENQSRVLVQKLQDSQDWCLSRQIQWGHRIPAFYHADNPEKWVVAKDLKSAGVRLEKILGHSIDKDKIIQDPDVLDTWFSSALIPLSVSGWPDSEDFREITLMETGHDILLFWIWRMAIMTLALVNRFPFRNVLLHGIVSDNLGRKMSKSRGNVIDPSHIINGITYEELLEETENSFNIGELDATEYKLRKLALEKNHSEGFPMCGTDALRLTLLSQDISDNQVTLDLTYMDNCRRFTNKLWQALRFLKLHSVSTRPLEKVDNSNEDNSDDVGCQWLLTCLYEFNKTAETSLNEAKFHLYAEAIRKFFYQDLCDVYIELIKARQKNGLDIAKYLHVMQYAFETGLKVAHPLIPFISEEIWSHLKNNKTISLLDEDFPSSKDLQQFDNPKLVQKMSKSMQLTSEIRSIKRRSGWSSKESPQVYIEATNDLEHQVKGLVDYISKLSSSTISFGRYPSSENIYGSYLVDVNGSICRIHIPLLEPNAKMAVSTSLKLEKMKLKLLKLQQQYHHPSFQQCAPQGAKEKLKKKVESLMLQISESENSRKPTPPNVQS